MRDRRERLLDMLEAIERIERYAAKGRAEFEKDELIQTWVVPHLQIVGGPRPNSAVNSTKKIHRSPGPRLLP